MKAGTKKYLQSLKFSQFSKSGVSPNDALIRLSSVIKKKFNRTPTSWNFEDNKIEVLESSVTEYSCARSTIDRIHVEITLDENFLAKLSNRL